MNHRKWPNPQQTLELTPEDVRDLAEEIRTGACILVDCREEEEWAINRLPDAKLAPLSRFGTEAAALLTESHLPCIIYCHHGMRSLRAVEWLRSHGYTASFSMAGGIHQWSERIDPTVPKY
ncbi:MAG: rhodanese-like domain-containing protein [Verrucomicrobiales bacterium]